MNIPTLSSYAPGPNLAQSYAAGVGLQQTDQAESDRVQMQKDQLAQQAQQAAMEASMKQQQIQAEAMKAAQELEVQKAYQAQSLALKHDELSQQQAQIDFKTQQAAQEMQAQQAFSAEASRLISTGKSPAEAIATAGATHGAALGDRSTLAPAISESLRPSARGGGLPLPTAFSLKDQSGQDTGRKMVQTGPETYSWVPERQEATAPPTGYKTFTDEKGVTKLVTDVEYKQTADEVKTLGKDLNNLMGPYGQSLVAMRALDRADGDESKLTKVQRSDIAKYATALKKYHDLRDKLERYSSGQQAAPTNAPGRVGKYTIIPQ